MKEIKCSECCVCAFKESLCGQELCEKYAREGSVDDFEKLLVEERKMGKWIYGEDTIADSVDGYRCDQCGFFVPWDYQHKSIDYIKDYNFCPNCGAKMEG
jgi:DNA-directed RNA polymerase subunit RPC12/RpoP